MPHPDSKFVETYAEIEENVSLDWRSVFRNLALDALSFGMKHTTGWDKYLLQPRVQFLYIHHVFKDEEKSLDALLKSLSKHHTFISYTEAWTRILTGKVDKPYIAFSSDDGLKNNLPAAAILKDYGASACFFICPQIAGEKDFGKICSFTKEKLHFPPVEFMDWTDIQQLQKDGHEIGSHTMSHINVAKTSSAELMMEIGESKRILDSKCGKVIHFAYPYGRHFHFSETGRKMVHSSGFLSCASAERGCHVVSKEGFQESKNLLLRRDHILLDWPLDHILFFLAKNSIQSDFKNNFYPDYADSNINKQ